MTEMAESRVSALEEIARGTKAALERIERQLETVQRNARSDFRWLLGLYLAGTAAILGVIAHTQHWI